MPELLIRTWRPEEELARVRDAYSAWGYDTGAQPGDTVYVVEREGHVIGLVRRTAEGGTLMLRGMRVAPEAQRQGVGTRMLEAFVAELSGRECFCISYAHLVDFYGQYGFEVESPDRAPAFLADRLARYRTKGLNVIIMRRPPAAHSAA